MICRLTATYLWIFYRFKEDGAALLGFQHPWAAHGHHGHHDHHHEKEYAKEAPGKRPMFVEDEDEH